jgi:hypothetical protein
MCCSESIAAAVHPQKALAAAAQASLLLADKEGQAVIRMFASTATAVEFEKALAGAGQ